MVVLSGGQDSTTCLFWAVNKYRKENVAAVTFDYGQRHSREIQAARDVAKIADIHTHEILRVGPLLGGTSPLTDTTRELEQYTDYASMDAIIGDRVETTFVPLRNPFFLILAANRAICRGALDLVTGVCQADNANYPDCRQGFVMAQEATINLALGLEGAEPSRQVNIRTPLMFTSKAESIRLARAMSGAAYGALAFSHTAYDGAYPPTGRDHATILRAQGFRDALLPDPLWVRAHAEGLCELPHGLNYHPELVEWASHEIAVANAARQNNIGPNVVVVG